MARFITKSSSGLFECVACGCVASIRRLNCDSHQAAALSHHPAEASDVSLGAGPLDGTSRQIVREANALCQHYCAGVREAVEEITERYSERTHTADDVLAHPAAVPLFAEAHPEAVQLALTHGAFSDRLESAHLGSVWQSHRCTHQTYIDSLQSTRR